MSGRLVSGRFVDYLTPSGNEESGGGEAERGQRGDIGALGVVACVSLRERERESSDWCFSVCRQLCVCVCIQILIIIVAAAAVGSSCFLSPSVHFFVILPKEEGRHFCNYREWP